MAQKPRKRFPVVNSEGRMAAPRRNRRPTGRDVIGVTAIRRPSQKEKAEGRRGGPPRRLKSKRRS